jgi:asparagine synthase (glutamine-hydrolysing)
LSPGWKASSAWPWADHDRRTVLIATDTVGSYPVYLDLDQNGLLVASDLSALLKARSAPARIDLRAVADYLTLGAVLGDRTLADGVKLLDPGSVLTYDVSANRVSVSSYARNRSVLWTQSDRQRGLL